MSSTETNVKKLLLIDGNGLAYRSFYAMPLQKSPLGLPINATLGFANLLLSALLTERPTHVIVAFDNGAYTERLLKHQCYNVQCEEMPDELDVQLPMVEGFVRACGLKAVRIPGFEADDCIATLAYQAREEGYKITVVSGDLELLQLVGPNISVLTTKRGIGDSVIYDEEAVKKKFSLEPSQLADLRALAGDSSQNIGGVPGIGEVTARKLLSQYNSLQELLDSLEQLPAKWRNPLSENKEDALEFKSRATIRHDLPIKFDSESCAFRGIPVKLITTILTSAGAAEEFAFILKRVSVIACHEDSPDFPAEALTGDDARKALDDLCKSEGDLSILFLLDEQDELYMASWRLAGANSVQCVRIDDLTVFEFWRLISPVLMDENRTKYTCYWRECYAKYHVDSRKMFDVSVASAITHCCAWEHSLEAVAARYDYVVYYRLLFFGPDLPFAEVPENSKLMWITRAVYTLDNFAPKVRADVWNQGLEDIFYDVEMPFALAMSRINLSNNFDQAIVQQIRELIDEHLVFLRDSIYCEADKPFDINNDKELGEFLFEHLGLLVPTRPKSTGAIHTEMLISLAGQHPIADLIRTYRELLEFKHLFVDVFLAGRSNGQVVNVVPFTKTFDLQGDLFNASLMAERRLELLGKPCVMGPVEVMHRMTAIGDNLLRVTIRKPLLNLIRKCLVPSSPKKSLLILTFNQLEYRLLSYFAKDEKLNSVLESDLGLGLAQVVLGLDTDEISYSERYMVTMLLLHYMSERWLARNMDIPEERAAEHIRVFEAMLEKRFPQSWEFLLNGQKAAANMEIIKSISGRQQRIMEAGSRNHDIRESAERFGRAFSVECSCTDILRKAVVELVKEFGQKCLVFPIYDEIIMEVDVEEAEAIRAKAEEILAKSTYGAPLTVSSKIHRYWFSL